MWGGRGDDDGGRIYGPSQTPSHHAGITYPVRVRPLTPMITCKPNHRQTSKAQAKPRALADSSHIDKEMASVPKNLANVEGLGSYAGDASLDKYA